jgi:hypothetical protein
LTASSPTSPAFVRVGLSGRLSRRGQPAPQEEVEELLDGFPTIFDPARAPRVSIGRDITTLFWAHGSVWEVIWHLTGRPRDDLLADLEKQQVVAVEGFGPE